MSEAVGRRVIVAVGFALFAIILVRTAWVCDDAYITFRTVDNFVHGYGLRWNIDERVQTYTHPLWMALFAAAYSVTREGFYTSIVSCAVCSLAAVWMLASKTARTSAQSILAFAALLSSKAFVDYSTSGLENALTHLLLVVFFVVYWDAEREGRLVRLTTVASVCLLNRLDLIFLLAPAVLVEMYRAGLRAAARPVAIGLLPLVAWETFSLIYYGFPFPNTAYAKLLSADVSRLALFRRGVFYARATGLFDPVTIAVILAGPAVAIVRRQRRDWPLVAGIILQALYVASVGGDFMYGRFFTPLVVCAVALLVHGEGLSRPRVALIAAAAAIVLGMFAADEPALMSGYRAWTPFPRYQWFAGEAIDERKQFFATTGLLNQVRGDIAPRHAWSRLGLSLRERKEVRLGAIGFAGYFAGPRIHIVDSYALADPLLARLPPRSTQRVGHFLRVMPEGYEDTVASGRNQIADRDLAAYYERLRLIVSGPIWTRQRFATIASMLAGRCDGYLERYVARAPHSDDERSESPGLSVPTD